jgi:hypothetical protein
LIRFETVIYKHASPTGLKNPCSSVSTRRARARRGRSVVKIQAPLARWSITKSFSDFRKAARRLATRLFFWEAKGMFENTIRRMPRPQDVQRLNTQELRDTFHITNLFKPGELCGTFTDLERLVVGGIMPVKPVELPNHKETGRAFFLERREFGAINIGGAGAVHADGKTFSLDRLDCVYLPMGTKEAGQVLFPELSGARGVSGGDNEAEGRVLRGTGIGGGGEQTDASQIHPQRWHSELPVGDGFYRTGGRQRVEFVPAAHALPARRDLFLLQPR